MPFLAELVVVVLVADEEDFPADATLLSCGEAGFLVWLPPLLVEVVVLFLLDGCTILRFLSTFLGGVASAEEGSAFVLVAVLDFFAEDESTDWLLSMLVVVAASSTSSVSLID